jgi:prolipoprotein diacylglyceryltransferase
MNPGLFHALFEAVGLEGPSAYVVFQALCLLASVVAVSVLAPVFRLPRGRLLFTLAVSCVVGLITSRVMFYLTASGPGGLRGAIEADDFVFHLVARPWQGGHVYYGGVLGALLAVCVISPVVFGSTWRTVLPRVLDVASFPVLLISVLGRLGCYSAGCCFGQINHVHGVVFPPLSAAAYELSTSGPLGNAWVPTPPLLPVQLYEAFFSALVLGFLIVRAFRPRSPGSFVRWGLGLYAVERFGLEFLRFDQRGSAGPFSTSQWVALGVFAVVVTWAVGQALKQRRAVPLSQAGQVIPGEAVSSH